MKNNLKRQVYRVLDRYGLFQKVKMKEWDYEIRDDFFKDFLIIIEKYAEQKRKEVKKDE